MISLQATRNDWPLLALLLTAVAVTLVVGVITPDAMPYAIGVLVLMGLMVFWAAKWDVLLWGWLWVFSYGLLDWPNWKVETEGFFNLTIPRMVFMAVIVGFGVYFILHKRRKYFDRPLLWMMLFYGVYIAANLSLTGWTAKTEVLRTTPYFKYFSTVVMPFVMFYLVYNVSSNDRQIRRVLFVVTLYGWYALYISYLQYASIQGVAWAREWIWPSFINDPEYGIHFDRARGFFSAAVPQAVFLVILFFVDLYLFRKLRGAYRWLLMLQAAFAIPAIFFTLLRSAYLAFLLCSVIWIIFASRGRVRWLKLATFGLVLMIFLTAAWERLGTSDRAAGGVAQMSPIHSRQVLLAQTWEIVKESPMMGVGFGHFADTQLAMERDPGTLVGYSYGVLDQHNLVLFMAAETGVIGLALLFVVLLLLFIESYKLFKKLPVSTHGMLCREYVVLFWVIFANFLTESMFHPLWNPFNYGLFWCSAAMIVGYNRLLENRPVDLPLVGDPAC